MILKDRDRSCVRRQTIKSAYKCDKNHIIEQSIWRILFSRPHQKGEPYYEINFITVEQGERIKNWMYYEDEATRDTDYEKIVEIINAQE